MHDASPQCSVNAELIPECRRALYLFAGPHRRSAIGKLLVQRGWIVHEIDILRQKSQDLSRLPLQTALLSEIKAGFYKAVISSPPCDTFSRAKFANFNGPRPTRTAGMLRGMKGLPKVLHLRNGLANNLMLENKCNARTLYGRGFRTFGLGY